MTRPIIEVRSVSRAFGMLRAVDEISLEVSDGEIVGIIGTNGSGKTTLLNLMTGYLRPSTGSILFQGTDVTGLAPRRIAALGIARSFQVPQLYTGLSVLENALIAVAAHSGQGTNFWLPIRRPDWLVAVEEVLSRFGLRDAAGEPVANLPEGGRKLLDVALSFILGPKLLLMDEPTSGVSAKDKFSVMDTLIPALKERGVTTVFVEHDMEIVERYAVRALAFDSGKVIADGPVASVLGRREVRRAVLGEE
jgi:branched-chain amino acid transport system ATP-binding protein